MAFFICYRTSPSSNISLNAVAQNSREVTFCHPPAPEEPFPRHHAGYCYVAQSRDRGSILVGVTFFIISCSLWQSVKSCSKIVSHGYSLSSWHGIVYFPWKLMMKATIIAFCWVGVTRVTCRHGKFNVSTPSCYFVKVHCWNSSFFAFQQYLQFWVSLCVALLQWAKSWKYGDLFYVSSSWLN